MEVLGMGSINDSSSVFETNKILGQHQALLMLLQSKLDDPSLKTFRWIDLGCGKGQVVAQLQHNLCKEARKKIFFSAFDIENGDLKKVQKLATSLDLGKVESIEVGDISRFELIYKIEEKFDFISMTNTIHEFNPNIFGRILVECILRLSVNGVIFIYDMESLPERELGAIPWEKGDIARIVTKLLNEIGVKDYKPEPGQWKHSSCTAWNIYLQRQYFSVEMNEVVLRKEAIIDSVNKEIKILIKQKHESAKKALEAMTDFGPDSGPEEVINLLYRFWALSRVMEEK